MKRKILMVPFHFPPMCGSSGVQRPLFFIRFLEQHGWEALVLTAHCRAHTNIDIKSKKDIPASATVKHTFAIDVARHLSFGGYFPRFLALPDRWSSWVFSAVWSGWRMIKKSKPEFIWTTYPISSSHLIGYLLYKITKIPWIADFRDPMTEENFPENPTVFKCFRWIESKTIHNAHLVIVTTPGVKKVYLQRYGDKYSDKIKIIQNGFDEDKFDKIEQSIGNNSSDINNKGPLRLVHSGYIYPEERNPEPMFMAISELKNQGVLSSDNLLLELRSSGHDEFYQQMLSKYGIEDIVKLLPPISHDENIAYILNADALLLLQGSTCNDQIPAKAYEYIRSGKPVVALTSQIGDTAQLLKSLGIGAIAEMEDKEQIKQLFTEIKPLCDNFKVLEKNEIAKYSRQYGAKQFAELLD